jgi:hypothetical protein
VRFRSVGFREQLSRLRARPVEVTDVAPHLVALRIEQDRGRKDFRVELARERHGRILVGRKFGRLGFEECDDGSVRPGVLADRENLQRAILLVGLR